MHVETLIYAYLAICGAMIVFNIVCIFVFRKRDANLVRRSDNFTQEVTDEIRHLRENGEISPCHHQMLTKKLVRIHHLMAFDETLEQLSVSDPEAIRNYLYSLSSVFVYLTQEYQKKNRLKAAYFPYLIKKYGVFRGQPVGIVTEAMLQLVREPNLYCRENALHALYSIGDADCVLKALKVIDESEYFHNPKLISDGLLTFQGNKKELDEKLWYSYPFFSLQMQLSLLDYFRFSSGEHCEKILVLMEQNGQNQEICLSCIRYFGKYHYEPALPDLLEFTEYEKNKQWEYAAVAATSLENYPGERTVEVLKRLLQSPYWYVRFNASKSLQSMGLPYEDLIDIFEGEDRYASEMLRYRMDQRQLERKGAKADV